MPKQESERERITRLQKQQISTRNPGDSKIRGYNWDKHNKKSKSVAQKKRETPLITELWELVPGRLRGALYGALFAGVMGAVLFAIIQFAFQAPDFAILALAPLPFGIIIGYVLGKTTEQKYL